jgi:hypothetical protein
VTESAEKFCKGEARFAIVEVNMGPDTTMLHADDAKHSFFSTWKLLFRKWSQMHQLGMDIMRLEKVSISFLDMLKIYFQYFKELSKMKKHV